MSFLGIPIDKERFTDLTNVAYSTFHDGDSLSMVISRERRGCYHLDIHMYKDSEWRFLGAHVQFREDGVVLVNEKDGGKMLEYGTPTEYGYDDIQDFFWNAEELKEGYWAKLFGHYVCDIKFASGKVRTGMTVTDGKKFLSRKPFAKERQIFTERLEGTIVSKTISIEDGHFDYDRIVTVDLAMYRTQPVGHDGKVFEATYRYIYDKGEWMGYYLRLPEYNSYTGEEFNAKTRETRLALHELIKHSGVLE